MKKLFRLLTGLIAGVMLVGLVPAAAAPAAGPILFADVGWDSIKLNNALAGLVAEEVYGYEWSSVPGSTPIIHEALIAGEVDIVMEEWTDNITGYAADREAGKFHELGVNFNDNFQGLYIPQYVAEEYPQLKTVSDLADYAWLFPDPEDSSKGIIYGGIPGWDVTEIMGRKVAAYGLDEQYNYLAPGSQAALDSVITSAWDKGQPIVAYYWEPTWLLGKYDMVLLDDSPYDPATFQDGVGACPAVTVTVAVSNGFYEKAPDFCEFLGNFSMSSAYISEALAYMQDSGVSDFSLVARWLLTQAHPELIDEWLPSDEAAALRAALGGETTATADWIFAFPLTLKPDTDAIDAGLRSFAVWADPVLGVIGGALDGLVSAFRWLLNHTPWFIILAVVFLLGWRTRRRAASGLLYAVLVALIGVAGLWSEMKLTLSIVLASVVIALALGLPIGIAISGSARANRIARPILDTMQTMPVFVYLIPALLLFGLGNPSAVIATVIYAIVPVIRLTSLGIRQVDVEVVEAARSFGSTKMQALFKVQIPQALPTIMTGVNQTLMMAMAMVVTCSMIGARGLGTEVLDAVQRVQIGRGLVAGACVVVLAVVLDRITQSVSKQNREAEDRAKGVAK